MSTYKLVVNLGLGINDTARRIARGSKLKLWFAPDGPGQRVSDGTSNITFSGAVRPSRIKNRNLYTGNVPEHTLNHAIKMFFIKFLLENFIT